VAKQRIASGAFDIFLLDEFTYLLHFGWLETAEVLAWIAAHKPPMLHLMITGRDAPRALIEAATSSPRCGRSSTRCTPRVSVPRRASSFDDERTTSPTTERHAATVPRDVPRPQRRSHAADRPYRY
jgi:hypothetical protein